MIIALDFDGVLHDPYDRDPGRRMGKPIPGALQAVRTLQANGHTLILHSCRLTRDPNSSNHVRKWLDWFGFPPMQLAHTKPRADLYVDDKGWRFSGWDVLIAALIELEASR